MKAIIQGFSTFLMAFLLFSCQPKPSPINFGEDNCTECKMLVSDKKFGAELVTSKGKVIKFDAIECLATFLQRGNISDAEIHSLWIIDFSRPTELTDARSAFYLHSESLRSPMGMNLSGFQTKESLEQIKARYDGEILTWEQVLTLIKNKNHS